MIAAHIMIQGAGRPGRRRDRGGPGGAGRLGEASLAGPCDVIIWAGTRDTGQLARMVASRARAPGGGTRAGGCPVAYR